MVDQLRAIDANTVLRYLLNDIPEHAARARGVIDSQEQLGLVDLVLAEVAWTLNGPRYRRERANVALELAGFLARDNIVPIGFDKAAAISALLSCAAPVGAPGLGDALIAAVARAAGIAEIYTFDRGFARTGLRPILPK